MIVKFEKGYLKELYETGKAQNKKYRFQPDVVTRYVKVINMMRSLADVQGLRQFVGLHYEHLTGDLKGYSSVRVNNKYRIEFTEETEANQKVATICNITELSNHYD